LSPGDDTGAWRGDGFGKSRSNGWCFFGKIGKGFRAWPAYPDCKVSTVGKRHLAAAALTGGFLGITAFLTFSQT